MNTLRKLFGIDIRSLALIRVCLGMLLFVDLLQRSTNLVLFYTDSGILPRSAEFLFSPNAPSIHFSSGQTEIQILFFIIEAIFALLLIVGYHTRTATIVCWLFAFSLNT